VTLPAHGGVSRGPSSSLAGFTLIELATVIGITAILAALAISRINTQSFDTEGFANRAIAMVRYAQKLAVSQRRTVAVVISGTNLQLCYTDTACSGGSVHEPPGTGAFSFNAPSGVALAGTSFTFNALGRPSTGGAITITGDVARTITIEAETGYVH
jgi:MSHA pilin protein MshC